MKKQRLRLASEKFNSKPLKPDWIKYAIELGLIPPACPANSTPLGSESSNSISDNDIKEDNISSSGNPNSNANSNANSATDTNEIAPLADAKAVAKFLKNTPGLGKTQIGEYLSKGPPDMYPFNAQVLRAYVDTFDFSGKYSSFDRALRTFLGHFRLPGEAQCIDRLMEAFAGKLFEHLGPNRPFKSADSAFILAFSTIMLNTDLHNPGIPQNKKMTKEEFLRNNRGINDGEDIPKEYLERLYEEIKSRQIQVRML